jgi:nucleoside-diphosphate-sugar epimerase
MSARVLITGASGGIGSAAMRELRARGAEVVGLDLEADAAAGVIALDVRDGRRSSRPWPLRSRASAASTC